MGGKISSAIMFAVFVLLVTSDNNPFHLWDHLEPYPFVRLLNADGAIGTSSNFNGESHTLCLATDEDSFKKYVDHSPANSIALAITAPLLTSDNLDRISRSRHVKSIAVLYGKHNLTAFSPANPTGESEPSDSHRWNPHGNSIRFREYSFPIVFLNENDSKKVITAATKNADKKFSYPQFGLFIDSFMHGTEDAETCLRRDVCQPIGGQSVWATFNLTTATKDTLMISSSADSDALPYRMAFGANSATSASVAVLLAAEALSHLKEMFTADRRVLFALFSAESFGHVGSRRFVHDLEHFKCTKGAAATEPGVGVSCDEPYLPDTAFTQIKLDSIKMVLDTQMVGGNGVRPNEPFFVHSPNSASNSFADQVIAVANGISQNVSMSGVVGVPPSPVAAFATSAVKAVVLSDFNDTFTDQFYHSRFDDHVESVERVCKAAEILATTAMKFVLNDTDSRASVNCTLAKLIIDCFTIDLGCDFLQRYGFPSDYNDTTWTDDRRRANLYSSVFQASSTATTPLLSFAYNFLAHVTDHSKSRKSCESHSDCKSGQCIASECVSGAAYFHRAVSLAFDYSDGSHFTVNNFSTSESSWTESNWQSLSVRINQLDDPAAEAGFLVFGLFLTLSTAALARWGGSSKAIRSLG
eukprot:c9647_g1_i1.p1 GENE.c9647_g1_i1~~c9647_g1_i1.p1  ORF type:complete len:641 (+),score=176.30 c9647_g1_i1:1-1923(+)